MLKKTGSFYYHCDWHASHYVKVMLDQILGDRSLDFMEVWYPIQVKQKDKVGRPDIDAFEAVMVREGRMKGFFVSFDYTSDALTEISRFFKQTARVIVPLTVKQILEDEIAMKLV